jgi:hypothetical protein
MIYNNRDTYHFILPSGEQHRGLPWKYTLDSPGQGWQAENYDDSLWQRGTAGFGYRSRYRFHAAGSNWDTTGIWLRRTFELGQKPTGKLYVNILSYQAVSTLFVNGSKLAVFKPSENWYHMIDFDMDLKRLLKPGKNTIAVHSYSKDPPLDKVLQRKLQFIDAGIIEVLSNIR